MYRDVITCATVTAVKVSYTLSHSPHDRRRSLPYDVLPRHAVRYSVIEPYFDYLTCAYFFPWIFVDNTIIVTVCRRCYDSNDLAERQRQRRRPQRPVVRVGCAPSCLRRLRFRLRHGGRGLPPKDSPWIAVGDCRPSHVMPVTVVEKRRSRGDGRPGCLWRRRLGVSEVRTIIILYFVPL